MAAFHRFEDIEDIEAWQPGRELTKRMYLATQSGAFSRDFALRDQIRRACISITSNIAEGYERQSRRDFARFLSIAKASNAEVRSQLYCALDLGYLPDDEFDAFYDYTQHIGRKLASLIQYLSRPTQPRPQKP
ncbi:MAG: four helix bundle protein [Bacteroidota bacterium]